MHRLTVDPAAGKPHAIAVWDSRWRLVDVDFGLPDSRRPYDRKHVYVERPFRSPAMHMAVGHLIGRMGMQLDEVIWQGPRAWKSKLCAGKVGKTKSTKLHTYPIHEAIEAVLTAPERRVYHASLTAACDALDAVDAVGIGIAVSGRGTRRGDVAPGGSDVRWTV